MDIRSVEMIGDEMIRDILKSHVEIMRNRACAELDPQSSFAKAKTQLQQSTRIYRMMIDSIDQWI